MTKLSFSLRFFFVIIIAASAIVPPSSTMTWSGEYRLTTYNNWDICPSIAQMSDGRIWVLWQSKRAQDFDIYYKIYNWTSWTNDTRLVSDLDHDLNPSIIQADNGKIWVFWASNRNGNYDIFYKTSSDNGGNWTDSLPLTTDTNDDTNPAAVQARNGTIWVVWQRDLAGNDEIFYRIYDGSSWSNEIQLTANPGFDRLPSITETRDGRIWIFWGTYRAEVFEIFYRIYDGSSWSGEMQLTASDNVDSDPTVVQDRNGTIWVVWTSHEPKVTWQDDLYYKTSSDNGLTWSDRVQLTSDPDDDMWASIAQISDKKIWVVWTSNRNDNYDIYYKTSSEISPVHNIAVTDVSSSSTEIYQGENVSINVVTENQGDFTEDVTVNCYVNSSLIGTQTATLSPSDSVTMAFPWDTSTFSPSIYVLKAMVDTVPGETLINTDDNTFIDGTIELVAQPVHDIAITNVEPAISTAMLGDFIAITVVAENQGSEVESFEVSCYANSASIGPTQVTSSSAGSSTEIYFTWNTTGFTAGVYVISATASGVEGEVDMEDNTFTDGTVELMEPIHDVTVMDVTPASNIVLQGDTISIDVTAKNQGTEIETFDVSCYVNSTSIGSQAITLDPIDSTLLTFTWNTSGFTIGNYYISATASLVPDEDDPDDNTFIDGIIELVAQPVHDIAIIGVTPSQTEVEQGESTGIDVSVKNEGSESETFDVTVYCNITATEWELIGTLPVTDLTPFSTESLSFTWDTTGVLPPEVAEKTYTIKANASVHPEEIDTDDNTKVDGTVTVYAHRDIAITNLTASATHVLKGESVNINVTVLNEGEISETFTVTVSYNITATQWELIGTLPVTDLTPGESRILTLEPPWNTTLAPIGNYTPKAEAPSVPREEDTADNVFPRLGIPPVNVTVARRPGYPAAFFSYLPSEPIINQTVTFNASDSTPGDEAIVSYEWDFDGDNIYDYNSTEPYATHNYTATGEYLVKLTVKNSEGNTDSVRRTVKVYRTDVAIVNVTASPTQVIVGESVNINVTVLNEGELTETFNITVYYDTTKIKIQTVNILLPGANTTLTFVWNTTGLATGDYVLKAEASTALGETDITDNSFTNGEVTLGMFPLAIFTYSPSTPVVGETITFDATGSTPNGRGISRYEWDFGDGTSGWGIILDYAYTTFGTYSVKLTIINSEGLANSTTKTVIVHVAPIASFAYTPKVLTAGEAMTFNASASYCAEPDGYIVSWDWDFGDGSVGSGEIVTHAYTAVGDYVVNLTITDNDGLTDSTTQTVTVSKLPVAVFTYSPLAPIVGETVTLNASDSTSNGGEIISYDWDFGDGAIGTGEIVEHIYAEAGTYTVTLTVTDNDGLTTTASADITISPAPQQLFPTGLIIIGVATAMAVAATAILLYRRRKKPSAHPSLL